MIILNEAKPKYERLDELLETDIQNIRFSNQVNIIVDLKEIVRKFFRPDIGVDPNSVGITVQEISSDLINTVGHYRNYFYKKGKYTTFYILYSYEKCNEMLKLYPEYKKEYYEKYFNSDDIKSIIIKKAVKVLQLVIKDIPHAYFIETSEYDEFVTAKYIQSIINKNELTYILSNDAVFFQLINENTSVINIKGIKSELLQENNIMNIISKRDDVKISVRLLPLVLSISGDKKYSISKIPGCALASSINIVEKLLENGIVQDQDLIEVPINFKLLNPSNKLEKKIIINEELIRKNYMLIKADNMLLSNKESLKRAVSSIISSPVVQHFKEYNSKIFSMFPLNIDMLLKGEKI